MRGEQSELIEREQFNSREDKVMSNEKAIARRDDRTPAKEERASSTPVFVPRVDIRETEKEVFVTADMPGVDENSVDIGLERHELTITGTLVPKAPEGYTLNYREYATGNYERTFTLGDTIDRDGIKAVVKDGVLHLTLPKAAEAQARKIAVKAG